MVVPLCQCRWYFKHFLGHEHRNYLGQVAGSNVIMSVMVDDRPTRGGAAAGGNGTAAAAQ